MVIETTDNPWDLFPDHRHLATEECGNEIVCDASVVGRGRVFGLWHDPPAIILLANSEREFHDRFGPIPKDGNTLAMTGDEFDSLFARVLSTTALPMKDAAAEQLGPEFAAWLAELPNSARIADMRLAEPGVGFEFSYELFARHPEALVFALVPPEKKSGFFGRLFGR